MTEIHTLGPWLERFLTEHIVTERNLASNTQKSYRDTFKLLLPFISSKVKKPVDRLVIRDLASEWVLQFLGHLEDDRGCSAPNPQPAPDGNPRVRPGSWPAANRPMWDGAARSAPFSRRRRSRSRLRG